MGTYFPTLTNMAAMLSNSASFQTFVGAGNAAAALLKIHYLLTAIDDSKFPFAAVTYIGGGSYALTRTSEGGGIKSFDNSRTINIVLEDKQAYTAANEQTFLEMVSDVIDDIAELSSPTNNYMLIDSISVADDGVTYAEAAKTFQAVISVEPRS